MLRITSTKSSAGSPAEGAAAAARALLKELCIADPPQIVLEDIAMTQGIYVLEGGLFGAEARLVRGRRRGIIRVRDMPGELGRKRFAVAHEIGHWVLHGGVSQLALCTSDDLVDYRSSTIEIEANAFAGELLMPSASFGRLCKEPDLEVVRTLADTYKVSLTAAALRFVEESKQDSAVVFSVDGHVKWFRSKDPKRIFVRPRMIVRSTSVARASTTADSMQPVDADVWFPGWRRPGLSREVQEQSLLLGRYGTVLTLLVVEDQDAEDDDGSDD